MTIQLGQAAPDVEQDSSHGRIRFHDWLGESWGVLFSHPKNYTPSARPSWARRRLKPEFDRRGVKVIGLSVDALDRHVGWEADIARTQGSAVSFPMIADTDRSVSTLYGNAQTPYLRYVELSDKT